MGNQLKLKQVDRFGELSIKKKDISVHLIKGTGIVMIQRAQAVPDHDVLEVSNLSNVPLPLDNCRLLCDQNGAEISSIGPTMWILQTSAEAMAGYLGRINAVGNSKSIYATNMTDQLVVLEVTGQQAASLFSKGCSLDFRSQNFPVGSSARSLLAQANVIFNHVEEGRFHLLLDVSLLEYLWAWIEQAIQEYE